METNSVEFFRNNKYQFVDDANKPILIAWKLRTPENYGSMIRIADTIGCEKILFVDSGIELNDRKIRKTAGDSYSRIKFEFVNDSEVLRKIPDNYELVAVETAETSMNIYDHVLPRSIALVVGNEKQGISSEFLAYCKSIVHIPLTGNCTSLNVTHATAIALFEWLRQNIK